MIGGRDEFATYPTLMTPLRTALLAFSMLFALAARAADKTPAALMHELAGVYKHRFMSATIMPGKAPGEADEPYQAEDVIELVPYDDRHLYLRAELEFYNGHSCSIAGMAAYEDGRFVYHDPTPPVPASEPGCALSVGVKDGKLVLSDRLAPDDAATCRAYCGTRGGWDYAIPIAKRRPIRYMERLKASRQYQQAVDQLGQEKTGR
jgi:hypothetical protein